MGWGGEDDDLTIKLADRTLLRRAWRIARTPAWLHVEHPRGYADPELASNRALLASRIAAGAAAMVEQDRPARSRLTSL